MLNQWTRCQPLRVPTPPILRVTGVIVQNFATVVHVEKAPELVVAFSLETRSLIMIQMYNM